MSDLHDDLTDIRGIGDATAEEIIEVVEGHTEDNETLRDNLESALDYYEDERYGYAGKYLRRAYNALE